MSVSTCGGLIHGGAYIRGGLIVGGLRYFHQNQALLPKVTYINITLKSVPGLLQ